MLILEWVAGEKYFSTWSLYVKHSMIVKLTKIFSILYILRHKCARFSIYMRRSSIYTILAFAPIFCPYTPRYQPINLSSLNILFWCISSLINVI